MLRGNKNASCFYFHLIIFEEQQHEKMLLTVLSFSARDR